MYGTAEAYRRGGQQFWYFFSHAASYTNHPDNPGSMFFDPETMDAQINNPGWLRLSRSTRPRSTSTRPARCNNGSGDVRPLYAGGTVAMNIDWADSGVLRATEGGEAAEGTVRTAMLPGLHGDLEPRNRAMGHVPGSRPLALPGLRWLAARRTGGQSATRRRLGTSCARSSAPRCRAERS
jgi:hypothetical protein